MIRCLVVDDSPVIRKVARHILEELGSEVDEAENGREALARCKARAPDVILLDWHIPGVSAHALLAALRSLRQPPAKLHILYCMTENDSADREKALAAGADDYLLKPLDRETLAAKLGPLCAAI